MMPAKLRVAGVDKTLRCEGRVDDHTVRLTATLPFLRMDGGVEIVLGENGEVAERGVIKNIAVDPSTSDGVPRLAVDVALANDTQPYGAARNARQRQPAADAAAPALRASSAVGAAVAGSGARRPRGPRSARRAGACTSRPRSRAAQLWQFGLVGLVVVVQPARHRQPAARPRARRAQARRRQKQTARIGMLGAILRSLARPD